MDIIDLLIEDHQEVDTLFTRFNQSSKPETVDELAKEIVRELSIHAAVEEQFVYPAMRLKIEGISDEVDHSIEEHSEVKQLLADLEKLDPEAKKFTQTMEEVISSVRHHMEEEQDDLFPRFRDASTDDFRENLGILVEKAKSVVPTHPHPLVPGTATAQLIAGPWASLVDHTRDLLR